MKSETAVVRRGALCYLLCESFVRGILIVLWVFLGYLTPAVQTISQPETWNAYSYAYSTSPQISSKALGLSVVAGAFVPPILTVAVLHFYLRTRKPSNSRTPVAPLTLLVSYLLTVTLSLALCGCLTNSVKLFVGRIRPDYLNRCFPSRFDASGRIPTFDVTTLTEYVPVCEAPSAAFTASIINDGRKSFPSGHSSYIAAVTVPAGLFLLDVLTVISRMAATDQDRDRHAESESGTGAAAAAAAQMPDMRTETGLAKGISTDLETGDDSSAFPVSSLPSDTEMLPSGRKLCRSRKSTQTLLFENLLTTTTTRLILVICVAIVPPIWAAATRVVDRRHHPTDVLGGLVLGATLGTVVYYLGSTVRDQLYSIPGTNVCRGRAR